MEKSGGGVLVAFAGVVLLIMGFNGTLGKTWAAITGGGGASAGGGGIPAPSGPGGAPPGSTLAPGGDSTLAPGSGWTGAGGGTGGGSSFGSDPAPGSGAGGGKSSDPRVVTAAQAAGADVLKYAALLGARGEPGLGVNPVQVIPQQIAGAIPSWMA